MPAYPKGWRVFREVFFLGDASLTIKPLVCLLSSGIAGDGCATEFSEMYRSGPAVGRSTFSMMVR